MLLTLPDELLLQIATKLDARNLVSLLATSHRTRKIAQDQRLWHAATDTTLPFDPWRDYLEDYSWRHGHLAVDVRSELAPKDEELFKVMSFFPLHRSYSGKELASLSPQYLPWATAQLGEIDEDLLILSCRKHDLVAHVYSDGRERGAHDGPQHRLLLLRMDREPTWLSGLPDWPLCATFVNDRHILVCGRFPAALVYDLRSPGSPSGVPLSSHTINCLSVDNSIVAKRILLCGHYKGRGSMEILSYHHTEQGNLKIEIIEQNKFAGVTAIVSCAFLPGGSFMTYDNYSHIYLWSSLRNAIRKIDHDGIGDDIPSDMIYKMFYTEGQLIFVDQYKRQNAFMIRRGHERSRPSATKNNHDRAEHMELGTEQADQIIGAIVVDGSGSSSNNASRVVGQQQQQQQEEQDRLRDLLFMQSNDMATLTRRILGI